MSVFPPPAVITKPAEPTDFTDLINNHLSHISALKKQSAELKEMLNSIFANDPTYQMHDKAVKDAVNTRNATKKQILKLPQAADLQNRIADLKSQLKEYQQALSGYLQDYARSTGASTFESEEGELLDIVYTAKLLKKN